MKVKDVKTGAVTEREYVSLYSMIPTKPHEALTNSGLATKESNGLLDVD